MAAPALLAVTQVPATDRLIPSQVRVFFGVVVKPHHAEVEDD